MPGKEIVNSVRLLKRIDLSGNLLKTQTEPLILKVKEVPAFKLFCLCYC